MQILLCSPLVQILMFCQHIFSIEIILSRHKFYAWLSGIDIKFQCINKTSNTANFLKTLVKSTDHLPKSSRKQHGYSRGKKQYLRTARCLYSEGQKAIFDFALKENVNFQSFRWGLCLLLNNQTHVGLHPHANFTLITACCNLTADCFEGQGECICVPMNPMHSNCP